MNRSSAADEVYDVSSPTPEEPAMGVYVAVSGNTAAGKSTLIEMVREQLVGHGTATVAVSERLFHHRYLPLMFSNSATFAFPIQLSFMLERHLVLLRNLELRRVIIMERSHLDDDLFVTEHAEAGFIAPDQVAAYRQLSAVLHSRVRLPDVLVLMNPLPETSLARLTAAEESGERPREFPNESAKRSWVERWYRLYVGLHEEFRNRHSVDPAFAQVRLIEQDPEAPAGFAAAEIAAVVLEMRG